MITFQKHSSHLVAVLTAVALAGCVKSDQANQSADSTARNLTLAPTESTAAMKDVPAPPTEAAKPAPEKKTPPPVARSEEHTSELQSRANLVCRLLLEK